jgi:hypothetical protein
VGKYLDLIKQSDGPAVSSKQVAGADLVIDDIDLQIDTALIVALIEAASRTPALDGIALERFARVAVEVNHVLAEVPPSRRIEATALASRTWAATAELIRRFHYFDAYQIVDELPAAVRRFLPS